MTDNKINSGADDINEKLLNENIEFILKKYEEESAEVILPLSLHGENLLSLIQNVEPDEACEVCEACEVKDINNISEELGKKEKEEKKLVFPRFSKRIVGIAAMLALVVCVGVAYRGMPASTPQSTVKSSGYAEGDTPKVSSSSAAAMKVNNEPEQFVAADYGEVRSVIAESLEVRDEQRQPNSNSVMNPDTGSIVTNPETGGGGMESDVESSSTNVQVEGIDEADIVKNDDRYIYTLTSENNTQQVSIVDAEKMSLSSSISIDEDAFVDEMYVLGDNLVLISKYTDCTSEFTPYNRTVAEAAGVSLQKEVETNSSSETSAAQSHSVSGSAAASQSPPMTDMEIAVGSEAETRQKNKAVHRTIAGTQISVYDIADRDEPKSQRIFMQDGSYVSSRLYDGVLYMVSEKNIREDVRNDDAYLYDMVPTFYDSSTDVIDCMPAENIIIDPEASSMLSYTVISAMQVVDEAKPVQTKAILGNPNYVYMDTSSLYITEPIRDRNAAHKNMTNITKIDIDGTQMRYHASGKVIGMLLNQFSVDSYNGNLRVATTAYGANGPENCLYVLDSELKPIGALEGLAKGETIKAVRFMGDVGYVVTYEKTDPLFVIDLKDPKNPKVLGELKIPGFSEYLHPLDDGKLLGIGVDTQVLPNGNVIVNGMKLSMFDVNDKTNPTELTNYKIGINGTTSEVLSNHKAITFFGDGSTFAFPIAVMDKMKEESNSMWRHGDEYVFMGLLVVQYTDADGFKIVAQIDGKSTSAQDYDVDFVPNRAVKIGDKIFSIAPKRIEAYSAKDYSKLGSVDI